MGWVKLWDSISQCHHTYNVAAPRTLRLKGVVANQRKLDARFSWEAVVFLNWRKPGVTDCGPANQTGILHCHGSPQRIPLQ